MESENLSDLGGGRVLLVEDNLLNQEVARFMLEELGLAVDVADNGQRALDALFAVPPETYTMVFMDMQMPIMDGLAATRVLRERPEFGRLPVIAMTANVMPEDKQRCLEAGMNDFVSKPITPEFLAEVFQRWLGKG